MNAENKAAIIQTRITAMQAAMRAEKITACVVPSSDPHISEYLPDRWKSREWLSGFTGSMGTLVVTVDEAAVFADSRYWVQAERELHNTGVALEKIPTGTATYHLDWLAKRITKDQVVAVDGTVMGLAAARALEQVVHSKHASLRIDLDLLNSVWANRPDLPVVAVYEHADPHATSTRQEKLAMVRNDMKQLGAQWHFISTLDDLAWLFNLRGQDVEYNPVFLAHALVQQDAVTLFVDARKIDAALKVKLSAEGIELKDYTQALATLKTIAAKQTVLLDPRRVTLAYRNAIGSDVAVIEHINPSTLAKSRKNAAQAQFVRQTMEQDGAALCEFFAWFEANIGKQAISELTVDEQITAARARRPGFVCPSFSTIAGFNANGALPHYRAMPDAFSMIEGDGLLLIDSGGQYLGGTTDITRVLAIGNVSAAMKRDFTIVLRGMINLSMARFPRGTLSPMLDAIARGPIWSHGIDFGHGTGHGVGYFLNVHEGPQSISRAIPDATMAMEPGMITSNEPGIYREGQWGVRIENLVMNVPFKNTAEPGNFGEFLAFETLTLCPIDTRCVDKSLMRADEVAWLNEYHAEVLKRLKGHVKGEALGWLEASTKSI
jgi:Xaa-Pro aminopeptidase